MHRETTGTTLCILSQLDLYRVYSGSQSREAIGSTLAITQTIVFKGTILEQNSIKPSFVSDFRILFHAIS